MLEITKNSTSHNLLLPLVFILGIAFMLNACSSGETTSQNDQPPNQAAKPEAPPNDAAKDTTNPQAAPASQENKPHQGWIDFHMHWCFPPNDGNCNPDPWYNDVERRNLDFGILQSLQINSVIEGFSDDPTMQWQNQNEHCKNGAEHPNLYYFAGLPCWTSDDPKFGEEGWVDLCKSQVDEWLSPEKGAIGFKDLVGKIDSKESSSAWLGVFNKQLGKCPGVDSYLACMQSDQVVYPTVSPQWREVVQYIVEEKKVPIVTHAATVTYPGNPATCYNPRTREPMLCTDLTQLQLLDFAEWAKNTLSDEARRRIVVAHHGFLWLKQRPGVYDFTPLVRLLDTGISVDTSAVFSVLGRKDQDLEKAIENGRKIRRIYATHPNQIVFGTDVILAPEEVLSYHDYEGDGNAETYEIYKHIWTGGLDEPKVFDGETFYGLNLDEPNDPHCQESIPPNLLPRIIELNAREILSHVLP